MLPKRFLFLANQNEIWIFLCKLQTLLVVVVSFTIFIYLFCFSLNVSWSNSSLQDATAHHNTCADSFARHLCYCQFYRLGHSSRRHNINHLCRALLLHLCYGLWSSTKYPLRGNLPYASPWSLHRNLCPSFLDLWYYSNLHTSRVAHFNWLRGYFYHLRYCLYHLLGIHLPEGSGNKGHASWSHHWVLCRRCKASCCFQEWMICNFEQNPFVLRQR